jgi:hypothetical protein
VRRKSERNGKEENWRGTRLGKDRHSTGIKEEGTRGGDRKEK